MPRVKQAAGPLPATALMRLMWLASPALPVGGFSYSEGLESAVEHGLLPNEAAARDWLLHQLQLQLQRGDMPVVAACWKAWSRADLARVQELNDWVLCTRESAEMRQQVLQMGRSLADWLKQRAESGEGAAEAGLAALPVGPTWPVAFALAAWRSGAPLREGLLAFGFGWAENMVQAAIKAVPLGQSAGQRILQSLLAALPAAAQAAQALPDSQRQSFAPVLAVLSARHEAQYSRLFRS